jgi:peptidyl-prolyl cis-trans isomerase A (cyclophilin A)
MRRALETALLTLILTAAAASAADQASKPASATAEKPETPTAVASGVDKAMLMKPAELKETAPATFKVKFETSKGDFVVQVTREWSPNGADRFYNLVKHGFYDDVRFFRVISGFMAQFGIHGDPAIQKHWREANILDDKVVKSNTRGMITYAKTGAPNSRSTQLFINFGDNAGLDRQGFSPFGQVVSGMDVVDKLYDGYGEGAPSGKGPNQMEIQSQGNAYLAKSFPNLDYIKTARIQ